MLDQVVAIVDDDIISRASFKRIQGVRSPWNPALDVPEDDVLVRETLTG